MYKCNAIAFRYIVSNNTIVPIMGIQNCPKKTLDISRLRLDLFYGLL